MDNSYEEMDYEEALRKAEWNKKIARMKREKARALRRRAIFLRLVVPGITILIILIVIISMIVHTVRKHKAVKEEEPSIEVEYADDTEDSSQLSGGISDIIDIDPDDINPSELTYDRNASFQYVEDASMDYLAGENMQSTNAILVNLDTGKIEGQVDYKARIIPASMTKVMTVLVAAEHVTSIKEKVPVPIEATDFAYRNDCSSVGFAEGEMVTIEDLFYGTILSSGGDAAATLAMYVAGDQETFVEMMNEKCKELGIDGTTHFTNTVGIHNENHYSTCYDMAVIMDAAMDNEFLRDVMSAKKYTTSSTTEHPDGISISNWFLRRIEDKDAGGEVVCAKTGYVVQSGNCGVSSFISANGTHYICVTANAHSAWRCIYDHVDIYKNHTN